MKIIIETSQEALSLEDIAKVLTQASDRVNGFDGSEQFLLNKEYGSVVGVWWKLHLEK